MDKLTFPKEIQSRITKEFLITFRDELDKVFYEQKPRYPTYWNHYQFLDNNGGFYDALETSCEIHNLNELDWYMNQSPWYISDKLGGRLTEMLYERKIIEKGTIGELYEMYPNPFVRLKYKIYLYAYKLKQYVLHN